MTVVPSGASLEIDPFDDESVQVHVVSPNGRAVLLGERQGYQDTNYYLGQVGRWTPERGGFLGTDDGFNRMVMRIEFLTQPVSFVGGLFNYPGNAGAYVPIYMTALDKNLNVLERHEIESEARIYTTFKLDYGEFRGISRDTNDIFALEITAKYAVIDDLRFGRVPEPSTALALATVLIALSQIRCASCRVS